MRNTYIIFSLFLLLIGFSVFTAPSKASAYWGGSYYNSYPYNYSPSYPYQYRTNIDNPSYYAYRSPNYVVNNNYVTQTRYSTTYPPQVNYNYNYNFYNGYTVANNQNRYPNYGYNTNSNYSTGYNMNNNYNYSTDYNMNNNYGNNQSCYGYGC